MEIWQTIILALGGNAVLLAVLGWLSKSFVSQLLEKDISAYRASLETEGNKTLENLKHQLEIVSVEHEVKFKKLHNKRAEVVAQAYSLLVQAQWDLSNFVSPMELVEEPGKKEKYVTAMNSWADFYKFFDKHRIYIPEKTCLKVEDFIQNMKQKAINYGVYVKYEDYTLGEDNLETKYGAWQKAFKYFEDEVPKTRKMLENELRVLLGDQ